MRLGNSHPVDADGYGDKDWEPSILRRQSPDAFDSSIDEEEDHLNSFANTFEIKLAIIVGRLHHK